MHHMGQTFEEFHYHTGSLYHTYHSHIPIPNYGWQPPQRVARQTDQPQDAADGCFIIAAGDDRDGRDHNLDGAEGKKDVRFPLLCVAVRYTAYQSTRLNLSDS